MKIILFCKWDQDLLNQIDKSNIILVYDEFDAHNYIINHNEFLATFFVSTFNSLDEIDAVSYSIESTYKTVDVIISLSEYSQFGSGYFADQLSCQHLTRNSIRITRNKYAMKKFANRLGLKTTAFKKLDNPSTQNINRIANSLSFPIVIKPMNGMGSEYTKVCGTRKDMDNHIKFIESTSGISKQLILEEYIEGEEFHADAIITDGQFLYLSITQYVTKPLDWKECPIEYAICINYDSDPRLYEKIRQDIFLFYRSLDLATAVFHYEFFINKKNEIVFSEIATRVGGGPTNLLSQSITGDQGLKEIYWNTLLNIKSVDNCIYPDSENTLCYINIRPKGRGTVTQLPSAKEISDINCMENFCIVSKLGEEIGRWGILVCFSVKKNYEINAVARYINDALTERFKIKHNP